MVERLLAKEEVAGSKPVSRSNNETTALLLASSRFAFAGISNYFEESNLYSYSLR